MSLKGTENTKIEYTFWVAIGMRIAFMYSVFHRILDLKTGWISIRAFFFVPTSSPLFSLLVLATDYFFFAGVFGAGAFGSSVPFVPTATFCSDFIPG